MTPNEINALATQLQPGQRFYYTGDQANVEAFGTITARIESPKWGLSYRVEFDADEQKPPTTVHPASFTMGPGQRFKTIDQHDAERAEATVRFTDAVELRQLKRDLDDARRENALLKNGAAANDDRPVVRKRRKAPAAKIAKAPIFYANAEENIDATVTPKVSIVLSGTRTDYDSRDMSSGRVHYKTGSFRQVFKVGDAAVYDGFNFCYVGTVTAIGKKTVTIETGHGGARKRLSISRFCFWNRRDIRFVEDERRNWSD